MNGQSNCVPITQNIKDRDVAKSVEHCLPETRPFCNSNYYRCDNGNCVEDVNGEYKTLTECQNNCSSGGGGGCAGCGIEVCFSSGEGFAQECPSPILIDIQGNGFDLTDALNGIAFDINGDGVSDQIAWTVNNSDDAWITLDLNGNGSIDNGTELFGNFTPQPPSTKPNGFLALAEYDKAANEGNNDGRINSNDAVFSLLRLWQDSNHNGISEAGELFSVPSLGVTEFDLDYKEKKKKDEHGNWFRYRAKVYGSHGEQLGRWAWDVFLTRVSQ